MPVALAAVFYILALVAFALAATDFGTGKFADRTKLIAAGLALYVVVHGGWDAIDAALH